MDQQKLSFVFYVSSTLALIYAAVIHSPLQFSEKSWENTSVPLVFFGIAAIVIWHVVFTGKALSQEKFSKVKAVSLGMVVFSGLIVIPGVAQTIATIPNAIKALLG